jgi:outer membrane lipoprotein-sorting protein
MKESIFTVVAALAVLLIVADGSATAAEFSADMVQTLTGQTLNGKIYVKDKKMRMEMPTGGMNHVTIMDPTNRKGYVIMEEQKAYMEIPWSAEMAASAQSEEEVSKYGEWKDLGSETVNGYPCEKRAFIAKDKSMGEMTQWFSKKLNYPIKMIHKGRQGEIRTEYKNIKEGGVPDSVFQIPAGYSKMDMPGFGK